MRFAPTDTLSAGTVGNGAQETMNGLRLSEYANLAPMQESEELCAGQQALYVFSESSDFATLERESAMVVEATSGPQRHRIDLFAGYCSVGQAAVDLGTSTHVLAYDNDQAAIDGGRAALEAAGLRKGNTQVTVINADINLVTLKRLGRDVRKLWSLGLEDVDSVHVWFPCDTFTSAMLADNKHRRSDSTARAGPDGAMAREADKLLHHVVELCIRLHRINPSMLITFENPHNPYNDLFLNHVAVRKLRRTLPTVTVAFDHCANTGPYDVKRYPGGWSRKDTRMVIVAEKSILEHFKPGTCRGKDCPHVMWSESQHGWRHKVAIRIDAKSALEQKRVVGSQRIAVPVKLIQDLWAAHADYLRARSGPVTAYTNTMAELFGGVDLGAMVRRSGEHSDSETDSTDSESDDVYSDQDERSDEEGVPRVEAPASVGSAGGVATGVSCGGDGKLAKGREVDLNDLPDEYRLPTHEGTTKAARPAEYVDRVTPEAGRSEGLGRYRSVCARGVAIIVDVIYLECKVRPYGGIRELVVALDVHSRRGYLRACRSRQELENAIRSIILESGVRTQGWTATFLSDNDKSLSKTLERVAVDMNCKYLKKVANAPWLCPLELWIGKWRDMVRCQMHCVKYGMAGMPVSRFESWCWSSMMVAHNSMAVMSDPSRRSAFEIDTGVAPRFNMPIWGMPAWIPVTPETRKRVGRELGKHQFTVTDAPPAKGELVAVIGPAGPGSDNDFHAVVTVRQTVRVTDSLVLVPSRPLGYLADMKDIASKGDGAAVGPSGPGGEERPEETDAQKSRRKLTAEIDLKFNTMEKEVAKKQLLTLGPNVPNSDKILDRVQRIAHFHMTVFDVLMKQNPRFMYTHRSKHGADELVPYGRKDLAYDLKKGYLAVQHPGEPLTDEELTKLTEASIQGLDPAVREWMEENDPETLHSLQYDALKNEYNFSVFMLDQILSDECCVTEGIRGMSMDSLLAEFGELNENSFQGTELEDMRQQIESLRLYALAQGPLKDLSWKEWLGPECARRQDAIDALEKELRGLQAPQPDESGSPGLPCLIFVDESDPEYAKKLAQATCCRALLDLRRDNSLKARIVIQGFREHKVELDGAGFQYNSNVPHMTSMRMFILQPRRGKKGPKQKVLSIRDVMQAFLQSNPFPKHLKKRYIKVRDPVTGKWILFEQVRPLYGQCSAPVRWEATFSAWLTAPESEDLDEETGVTRGGGGFVRGENERSLYWHPRKKFSMIVWVDDLCRCATIVDTEWLDKKLDSRFKMKPPLYLLSLAPPLDLIGINLYEDEEKLYMSMEAYITNMFNVMFPDGELGSVCKKIEHVNVPMRGPIDDLSPALSIGTREYKRFRTGLGMIGWVSGVLRYDCAASFSRIGQFTASPNVDALDKVEHLIHHLYYTRALCLVMYKDSEGYFRAQTDSDLMSNSSFENKGRSQMSHVLEFVDTQNNCYTLIVYAAKFNPTKSHVATKFEFKPPTAHERIQESHIADSSATAELYAFGYAVSAILAITYVMEEAGIQFVLPIQLGCDNAAALAYIANTGVRSNVRHINAKMEWIKCCRDASLITPIKVPSQHNMADLGTKILDHLRVAWIRSRWYVLKPLFGAPSSLEYESLTPDTTPHIADVVDLATEHVQMIQQLLAHFVLDSDSN